MIIQTKGKIRPNSGHFYGIQTPQMMSAVMLNKNYGGKTKLQSQFFLTGPFIVF